MNAVTTDEAIASMQADVRRLTVAKLHGMALELKRSNNTTFISLADVFQDVARVLEDADLEIARLRSR